MSPRKKGPKQQTKPNLTTGPDQPYGTPIEGSHKVKNQNHSRQNQKTSHDM
ncbi:small acid-soluble spore protein P [Halobacillus sp. K22]|uniref:small acid-soluble spore protein P n=1 Tax=Halobacillus sp. K22 TaxID=3457431 RepID=UPI003FCD978A